MSYHYNHSNGNTGSTSEHLTIEALQDHDKWLSTNRGQASWSLDSKKSDSVRSKQASDSSRRSNTSIVMDNQSPRKTTRMVERPCSKLNPFKLVYQTRAWQKQARKSARARKDLMRQIRFENTYQTEPGTGQIFNVPKVTAILESTLSQKLRIAKYSVALTGFITMELTENIKRQVKLITSPRYKIVCIVLIGQNKKQGMQVSSRCLWNLDTDSFASFTFKNHSLVAVANVYGLYYE